jgi:predicted CoA-substrate-specific enzyme activase
MIFGGIDAGSRAIKAVLWDAERGEVLASGVCDQGVRQEALARDLFQKLLDDAGIGAGEVSRTVATGYGRNLIGFADATITEITCHARGVRHLAPEARTVIDIGGQDSKVIRLSAKGWVQDFAMNDRCAAGTGRFLEVVSARLGVEAGELGNLASRSISPAPISSMCVVFAETEIVGLLASGAPPEDIVAGVQHSIAQRVAGMAGRNVEEPVLFTGGVALVSGMPAALEAVFKKPVRVAANPQFTGALGAALLAASSPA